MKKVVFPILFACTFALAQTDFTGYADDADAAYAELDRETQGGEVQGDEALSSEPQGSETQAGPAQEQEPQEAQAQGGSAWEEPPKEMPANTGYTADVTVQETSTVTTAPSTPKEETWEEAWQKRRLSVSFSIGFLPMTTLADVFVDILDGEDEKDPDATAYTVSVGYEFFYLLEVGLMVDYTTVAQSPVVAVVPRIKLNWLNFKYFRLYSYGGLGGIFWDDGGYVMVNFAVLGFEVGNHLSVFFEGGWGQAGMFIAGVKLAF